MTSAPVVSISITLFDRNVDRIVDAQQARLARLGGVGIRQAQRVVGEAGIGARIFIGPEPLLADRLDGDVGLGMVASK